MKPVRAESDRDEWLEADGLGGFASGTASGVRTRRYHALLLPAVSPPADRRVLVSDFAAWLRSGSEVAEVWPHVYDGGFRANGDVQAVSFEAAPWPRWHIATRLGALSVEIFVPRDCAATVVRFRLEAPAGTVLEARPLLAGRDFHSIQRENPAFRFQAETLGNWLELAPYPGVPSVRWLANASYRADPDWYRRFFYSVEAERGLEAVEDLASPGVLSFSGAEGAWILTAAVPGGLPANESDALSLAKSLESRERARRAALADLDRAAEQYLVRRGEGRTLIAGYPWFGDWGRDTFISLRGLCLARGDWETARAILLEWARVVDAGMLPNRFPDSAAEAPEYNAVDASLWYVLAASELLQSAGAPPEPSAERRELERAILEIVTGFGRGTRHGIRRDADGLLACGEPGVQLTWMDARVDGRVVTPRVGKPIEVQALWIHALHAAARVDPRLARWEVEATSSLEERFWNSERSMLFDVVDEWHVSGRVDASFRPNQIFAVGGLPATLISPERARRVVDAVERELWTPLGLRTLAPSEPGYRAHYAGGVAERDGAYHQGTAWPWLLGPFVEAWVKSRGRSEDAKRAARDRFVTPLREHLRSAGLGHVSEVADAEAPHTPGGCPFQAWSLGELIRLERVVLA